MRTEYYSEAVCPECGKVFPITPEYALTNGRGAPVCSPHCSTAAWKREEARLQEMREQSEKLRRAYEQRKRERRLERMKAQIEATGKAPGKGKVVDLYTKEGEFVKRYPSYVAASLDTGYSPSWIGKVCRGLVELHGDYTFKYPKNKGARS